MAINEKEASRIFWVLPDLRFKLSMMQAANDFVKSAEETNDVEEIPHMKELEYILLTVDNFKNMLSSEDRELFELCYEKLPRQKKAAIAIELNLTERSVRRRIKKMCKKYADNMYYLPENWIEFIT